MTQALSLDPRKTALVMIDLQHGIVSRAVAPHSGAQVVEKAKVLADALRAQGGTVVWVHVLLNELLALPADNSMHKPGTPPAPAIASELVPEIGQQDGDVVIAKRQWGAFHGTNLEQQLRRRGIDTIVLGGIATNFGVESTARAAFDQGFKLVFVEDATSGLNEEMHRFSFEKLFGFMGHVRTTQETIAAMTGA
ncbi:MULTISPECIES: isochorismatase family protein [Paraburkholderia]|uniref:Nicotinamidase-related amidase n=1 Tax=Paraburkholderia tropica TaxID=92647 RepID=A0A1A5X1R1_9BURK|nr:MULTISPECIES: isochorismatase family protein [Paraburkholderia]MBB2979175.1 nicotinamidase-related amidase [Paraburkholderia tropica]MBB3002031.1 nicotinamidase-related amidase [Paraburkholderia tropica]MBB6321414.1 nicotinamidase-related amidase [Paraburkholderia tropica]MDE1143297.1 isochorismatase family protein [Paraburkholderia tropica]OBR47279.1 isochorismatase [Paraburkholderia tropica]